jgi:acyl dehydratase
VWLGTTTTTDAGVFATYERCALLPCRGEPPGHGDEIPGPEEPPPLEAFAPLVPAWDLSALPPTDWAIGEQREDPMRDIVDLAPALARLTLNQALIHRDATRTVYGRRLVYGGHVQALAQASLTRCLPGLATVLGWDGCDHLGPAFEGDLLAFRHRLVDVLPVPNGSLCRFEVRGARVDNGVAGDDLLLWTAVVLSP